MRLNAWKVRENDPYRHDLTMPRHKSFRGHDSAGARRPRKAEIAYGAYKDLMDAADWLREQTGRQLANLDLGMSEFQVLEMVYHEGPKHKRAIAQAMGFSDQACGWVIGRLEAQGWVRRSEATMPPSGPRSKTVGRRIVLVHLTEEGEKLIANVFPKHVKLVRSELRVLGGREQRTLSGICKKLRRGDVMKFVQEITHIDPPTR
jgi:MarR family transcriptional regulator, 2-MHQ and catechol-resistance regulon repressor